MNEFPSRLELLESVFNASHELIENSRVSGAQSRNADYVEYIVPTEGIKRLWYALETLKAYDKMKQKAGSERCN